MKKVYRTTKAFFLKIHLLCFLAIILFSAIRVEANVDSLKQIWSNISHSDSIRFNAINEYYQNELYSQPDSVILLTSYHIELAQEYHSEKQRAIALRNKAIAHDVKAEYNEALIEIKKVVDIYTSLKDSINLIKTYNVLANVYSRRIEYQKAITYYSKSLAFFEANNNHIDQGKVLINIGLIHFDIQNYDLALKYYYQALQLFDKNGLENRAGIIWLNIAQVNLKNKDYQLAIKNSKQALEFFQQLDLQFYIAYCFTLNARIYLELNQLDNGLLYIEKARKLHQDIGNDFLSLEDQIILSKLIQPTDVDKAIKIGEEALIKLDNHHDHSLKLELYHALCMYYKEKGESKLALSMLEKYTSTAAIFRVRKNQVDVTTKLIQNEYENKILTTEIQNEQVRTQLKLNQLIKIYMICFIGAFIILFTYSSARTKRIILNQEKERLVNKVNHLLELKNTRNQLIQSDKMASLGQLTAGVAHEINNPVNFISSGIIGLKKTLDEYMKTPKGLEDNGLVKDMNDMLLAIEEGAKRTSSIVKSLRLFSREDTENYIEADVVKGLESTITLLSNKIEEGVFLEKDFEKNEILMFCFPGQLNQVFMNILVNAIQAVEGAGTIKVKVEEQEKDVVISITDNGVGIPEDNKHKIFDPFYTTKSIQEGTGLGLSISFGIIKKHKGLITVRDNKPTGTQFVIQLPKKDSNLII